MTVNEPESGKKENERDREWVKIEREERLESRDTKVL